MTSVLAMPQCGQVMTDSRIMAFQLLHGGRAMRPAYKKSTGGCQLREPADPRSADTEAEQNKRRDAT
jgi:hypothetical protein